MPVNVLLAIVLVAALLVVVGVLLFATGPKRDAGVKAGRAPVPMRTRWNPYEVSRSRSEQIRTARRAPSRAGERERNYYALLGVSPGASDAAVERAYRRKVAAVHPDRYFEDGGKRAEAEQTLRTLNEAMAVLRDPVKRARYDAGL